VARRIQQQPGREDHEQAATERRVRALLAELKRPAAGMHLKALDPHGTECGLAALQTAGREFASAATAVCGGVFRTHREARPCERTVAFMAMGHGWSRDPTIGEMDLE